MELNEQQYEQIKEALPVQRGNVRLSNRDVLNAILYRRSVTVFGRRH